LKFITQEYVFFPLKTSFLSFLVEDMFIKRLVCINCKIDLPTTSKYCSQCTNNKPKRLALVYDVNQEIIFTQTYDRVSSIIKSYRETFSKNVLDNETNDIVYNKNYKILYRYTNYPFISVIIHLDGIKLDKSSKNHLWILSCALIELPPAIRIRRQNNLILSMWIAEEQPNVNLWLHKCLNQLASLKVNGKSMIYKEN
jgi:hypothetical protein